ncbi:MAG: GTP-binding protein [Candidatus Altiarchaeales archaeon]|nr:MAG: GTP-binding protein [Candidatus Altiarchaeales archaeon]
MPTIEERIREIEEEIRKTPYNKKTQHHIGRLKAKLARLREELISRGGGGGARTEGIRKFGDASVALVGFPSVGKSTLLNKLTNVKSKIAEYEFTTLSVIPGMMKYNGADIQLIDLPGIIEGASIGRGRGKEILSVIRNMDLILIIVDALRIEQLGIIEDELYKIGIRLNQRRPDIKIERKHSGGIHIISNKNLKIKKELIKEILNEYKIHSADVTIHEEVDEEKIIDAIVGNRVYIPSIIVINKIDLLDDLNSLNSIGEKIKREFIPISAKNGTNLDVLKDEIFRRLGFIRIYMKPPGKEADMEEPLIMKSGSRIIDVCDKIHQDIKKGFRYARVWGNSVRFDGQIVGLEHEVKDGDIVTIITR